MTRSRAVKKVQIAIDKSECNDIKKDYLAGRNWSGELPYIEAAIGTGRASCRQCGNKIKKGEKAIKFPYSFTDGSYNAWTAVTCQIHVNCPDNLN